MIDTATKQKVIDLYNDGKNKTEIHNITKISIPSIRGIVEDYKIKVAEQKLDGKQDDENITAKISDLEIRMKKLEEDKEKKIEVDDKKIEGSINRFIINTIYNWPRANLRPYQRLRKGVRIEDLSDVLEIIFPQQVVKELMMKIENTGHMIGLFEATVIEKPDETFSTTVRLLP
jgi:hypothetical protein